MLEQGHPALSPNISNNRHLALTAGLLLEQIRGKWTLTVDWENISQHLFADDLLYRNLA